MNINATLLGQTLAFVIFVAICWKYVWPPIIAIMEEREKRIADGLEAAKKAYDVSSIKAHASVKAYHHSVMMHTATVPSHQVTAVVIHGRTVPKATTVHGGRTH